MRMWARGRGERETREIIFLGGVDKRWGSASVIYLFLSLPRIVDYASAAATHATRVPHLGRGETSLARPGLDAHHLLLTGHPGNLIPLYRLHLGQHLRVHHGRPLAFSLSIRPTPRLKDPFPMFPGLGLPRLLWSRASMDGMSGNRHLRLITSSVQKSFCGEKFRGVEGLSVCRQAGSFPAPMPPARGGRYAKRQTNYSKIWGGLELWLCSVSAKERGLLMTVHDPKRAAVLRGLQAEECSGRGSIQVYHRITPACACTVGDGLPGPAAGHSGGAEGEDGAASGTEGFEGGFAGQEEARRRHYVGVDTSREIDEASARVGMDVRLCDGATGAYDTIFVPVISPLPLPPPPALSLATQPGCGCCTCHSMSCTPSLADGIPCRHIDAAVRLPHPPINPCCN